MSIVLGNPSPLIVADSVDIQGEIEVNIATEYENYATTWLNKDEAIELIDYLKKAFQL